MRPKDVRTALERMVADHVAPIGQRYDFSPQLLNLKRTWKPIVLFIGNYSSGKSTLINELVGGPIQRTGQAPTDDSFTVLVGPEQPASRMNRPSQVLDETPGRTLVNDDSMPFGAFKEFGERFMAHFVMKKVDSPLLENLALIDSPGMLDSVAELDRGYDYQAVVGRLAELADLVVLVFDPHRAGTIKETYVSIRSTLPKATSEDRVFFVMNRVDECKNLLDLLRCYGSLCWNLSQMTGRKDIPRVFLTYSPTLARETAGLDELSNERTELLEKVRQAPRLQVNHWLGSVDNHLHKLELIVRTMSNTCRKARSASMTYLQVSIAACVLGAFLLDTVVAASFSTVGNSAIGRLFEGQFVAWSLLILLVPMLGGFLGAYHYYKRVWHPNFKKQVAENLAHFAELRTRYDHDLWDAIEPTVRNLLDDPKQFGPFAVHVGALSKLRRLISQDMRGLYLQHFGHVPEPPTASIMDVPPASQAAKSA